MNQLDLDSRRAKQARLRRKFSAKSAKIAQLAAACLIIIGLFTPLSGLSLHLTFLLITIGLLLLILALWQRHALSNLGVLTPPDSWDDILSADLLGLLKPSRSLTNQDLWQAATKTWSGRFVLSHLLIDGQVVEKYLPPDLDPIWQKALELNHAEIDGGSLVTALILSSSLKDYLASLNLSQADILETHAWQQRLASYLSEIKPYYGGVGRDWASGFTPLLNQFGLNISRLIETGRAGLFDSLAHHDVLKAITSNLSQSGGVALVGETGSGKTSLAYALAQHLLEGKSDDLKYYQIYSLDAATILATGHNLERLLLHLFSEAALARNIILFLDNANLFFGQGIGAFDMGQLLSPVMESKSVKLLAAFTPNDYQRFKVTNGVLAGALSVVTVAEPAQSTTMKILEDTALTLEPKDRLLISFQAVREAYRLADQYLSDSVFPGKAISLLSQATAYSKDHVVSAESVAEAVEKSTGIKTSKPADQETNVLINLEDRIHARMINQDKAVKAVATALRRGRTGVANPTKPVGAFLFLGPTGVGKTELARSLAATYFGSEDQLIRLDMTEYAGDDATTRLLNSSKAADSMFLKINHQPFSVVLLDEVEKAHPSVLNLLLQLLDEGRLTDATGKSASFKNAIIICTSNAGSANINEQVETNQPLDDFAKPLINKLIKDNVFKPELINRFDEVVLFRPLNQSELKAIALLMLGAVNQRLAKQQLSVKLTEAAITKLVEAGYDRQFGARPMRRAVQTMVEDQVASQILSGQARPGSTLSFDVKDLGQPS